VDVLVTKNWVTRLTDADDRRHIHLSLTEKGQQTLSAIYAETEQWLAKHFQSLTGEQAEQIAQALSLLRGAFNHP
jgi:DNA-binding MarR family transcriptional regulator